MYPELLISYQMSRITFTFLTNRSKSRSLSWNASLVGVNFADRVERRGSILLIAGVERVVDVRIKSRGHLINQKLSQLCLQCWR